MMLDKETTLSEEQAITASAISTDVYDLGASLGNLGAGQPLMFESLVTADFATLTSLTIEVVAADNAALTTNPVVVESSGAVLAADLVSGYRFAGTINLHEKKQFIGFRYTVGGADATTGAVTSFINLDVNSGDVYAANYTVQTN